MKVMKAIRRVFKKTPIPEDMLAHCDKEKLKKNQAMLSLLMPFFMVSLSIIALFYTYLMFKSNFAIKNVLYVVTDSAIVIFLFVSYFGFKVHKIKSAPKAKIAVNVVYFMSMLWGVVLSALDENATSYIMALLMFSTVFIIERKPFIVMQAIILPSSLILFLLLELEDALVISIFINIFFGNCIAFLMASIKYSMNMENFMSRKIIERQNLELREMADTDGLTGVYNRRFFDESLKRLINTLSRSKCTLSLMMVDIDFFKKFNDTYGHIEGDECLKTIAKAIMDSVKRADDFVARYGGEEFAVVLPNTNERAARVIAERIHENIKTLRIPHINSDVSDYITVSIGVATGVAAGNASISKDRLDYIRNADEMLYKSKKSGRNQTTFTGV